MLGKCAVWDRSMRPNISLVSTSSEQPFRVLPASDLFRACIYDIFSKEMDLRLVGKFFESLPPSEEYHVQSIGPGQLPNFVVKPFRGKQVQYITDGLPCKVSPGFNDDYETDQFAIVGMAGRYPGADTAQELWNILENAQTRHMLVRMKTSAKKGILLMTTQTPKERFDVNTHVDSSGSTPNTSLTIRCLHRSSRPIR